MTPGKIELRQRMITSAPVENLTPSPPNPPNASSRTSATSPSHKMAEDSETTSIFFTRSDSTSDIIKPACKSMLSSSEPLTPPTSPHLTQISPRQISSISRIATESGKTARRNLGPYKPVATTVTKTGLFGIGKRTKMERIVSPPDNPLVGEYFADAVESSSKRFSYSPSITTANSLIYEPDHATAHSWRESQFPSSTSLQWPTELNCSFDSVRRFPTDATDLFTSDSAFHSNNSVDLLPSEMNNFAGFCKGAWRQQIGDTERAMEERVRPGGMYNQAKYWQCKHCKFEGRLVPIDRKNNGYDTRVFKLVEGVQFRWKFMFKTHVANSTSEPNPTKATFGCIFCCSNGRGTPVFNGIQSFMDHLVEHRQNLPNGEVLYRMNTLIGRQATVHEDFDVNFVSLEEGKI